MKRDGKCVQESYTQVFPLPRPDGSVWALRLSPLPLGFFRKIRDRGIIPPKPPIQLMKDSAGRPMRDAQGEILTRLDPNDPEYINALETYQRRVAMLMIAESLREEPSIEFESRPTGDSYVDYADGLHEEFERAGLSLGDVLLLCEEISRLSQLLPRHLEGTRRDFLGKPEEKR